MPSAEAPAPADACASADIARAAASTPRFAQGRHTCAKMVRSAWMAQIERCKRQRLRRHSANSAGGMGGADHGARADFAPGCARRREAALQGAGREGAPYRPSHARRIRGWIAHRGEKRNPRWRSGEPSQSRQRARANRAPHRPRQPSGLCAERWRSEADAPEGNLPIVERCGRTRRHALRKEKHGWGEAVRTLWRQGKGTPYGGKGRTRHRTHNTRMKMGKLQAKNA